MSKPSAVVALVLSFLSASTSNAEIIGGESLEWIVADSDLIVRGRITDVQTKKAGGQVVWETATVQVEETIKGPKSNLATFAVRHFGSGEAPSVWKQENVELLLFLVGSKRYVPDDRLYELTDLALRKRWGIPSFVRLNDKPKKGLFTINFKVLKKRDDILHAVRKATNALKKLPKPKEHQVDVPFSSPVFQTLWGGSSVYLVVPVDRRLEQVAHGLIKSDDVLSRVQGVRALEPFKSDDNIRLLKSLLGDTAFWITSDGDGKNRRRILAVRKAAYEILRGWKVDVEQPEIEMLLK